MCCRILPSLSPVKHHCSSPKKKHTFLVKEHDTLLIKTTHFGTASFFQFTMKRCVEDIFKLTVSYPVRIVVFPPPWYCFGGLDEA